MAIAAIDFGRRRIGLAIAYSSISPPLPIGTIERRSTPQDLAEISSRLKARDVTLIIVGLPLNMDGTEGPSSRAARSFGVKVGEHLSVPIEFYDERLTSFEAKDRLIGDGQKRPGKDKIDALAATIILEGWLEAHHSLE